MVSRVTGRGARREAGDRGESGQAIIEMVIVMPLLLLLVFGIVEFANAWRTYHVVTNSAREGARLAVLNHTTAGDVTSAVESRLAAGGLDPSNATISLSCDGSPGLCDPGATGSGDEVQIDYPYEFVLIGPIAGILTGGGGGSKTVTLTTLSVMRHE